MKWIILLISVFIFSGCDSIGLNSSYPSIYTKISSECSCNSVMYILKNTGSKAQNVTIIRTRQSGTASKKRLEIKIIIQPRVEKKLGCADINLYISRSSSYCDTTQSFYVKKSRELK